MGNHEFYKYYDIANLHDGFCVEIRKNVHSYYNSVVSMDGVDIIISTLWSSIALENSYYTEQVVSDFRRIMYKGELLTFSEFNNEHRCCLEFIKSAVVGSTAQKRIVVTHHVPSFLMQCPKFTGSKANGAFTVELKDYIEQSNIDYWIYGHSHYNVDVKIGNTWCVSNQLGYVFHDEHLNFDSGKTISISDVANDQNNDINKVNPVKKKKI